MKKRINYSDICKWYSNVWNNKEKKEQQEKGEKEDKWNVLHFNWRRYQIIQMEVQRGQRARDFPACKAGCCHPGGQWAIYYCLTSWLLCRWIEFEFGHCDCWTISMDERGRSWTICNRRECKHLRSSWGRKLTTNPGSQKSEFCKVNLGHHKSEFGHLQSSINNTNESGIVYFRTSARRSLTLARQLSRGMVEEEKHAGWMILPPTYILPLPPYHHPSLLPT